MKPRLHGTLGSFLDVMGFTVLGRVFKLSRGGFWFAFGMPELLFSVQGHYQEAFSSPFRVIRSIISSIFGTL
jgi:hypothetical protein